MSLVATDITHTLAELVRNCTTRRGYTSNVGAAVYVGLLRGAAQQAPSAWIIPGLQRGSERYGELREVTREYKVSGFADHNDHPSLDEVGLVDLIIWDLRRCIESQDDILAAMVERLRFVSDQPGYREEGGTIVGATLSYELTYLVNLTDPETPA